MIHYWFYPTSSDSAPTIATANATGDISNPGTNVANYSRGADWNGQDGTVTTVGTAGAHSASFYGTFDQGGNVFEWNEAVLTRSSTSSRGLRGANFNGSSIILTASIRFRSLPSGESSGHGFRVASVPEPSTLSLFGLGSLLMLSSRRRIA